MLQLKNSTPFAASLAPAAALNSFCGMTAELKVASAAGRLGSGCLSVRVTRLPFTATLAMESSWPLQAPLSGLRARSRLHFTSLLVMGEPSANLMPLLSVRRTILPSGDTT